MSFTGFLIVAGICVMLCVLTVMVLLIVIMAKHIRSHRKEQDRMPVRQGLLPDIPEPVFNEESPEVTDFGEKDDTSDISEEELTAVIAAAIAAYCADCPAGSLIVKRIRRIPAKETAWSGAAKMDCIESRKF